MLIQERICNFAKTKNATTEKEMNNCLNCLTTLLLLCWNLLAINAKTNEMRTVTVNGATRAYWLYVPDKVSAPAPLVLSLHGTGGHAADKSPFRTTVADQEGCIVAYPQGEDIFFPVFGSTLPGWHATGENSNDIEFFKAVINDVAAHFSIDRKRVYCCGFSNGGMMAYTAACVASDVFAAFASISGYPINEFHLHQTSVRPVPFLHIHGKADDFVRYRHMPVIVDNMVARNGCNPVPKKIRGTDYDKSVYEATEGCFSLCLLRNRQYGTLRLHNPDRRWKLCHDDVEVYESIHDQQPLRHYYHLGTTHRSRRMESGCTRFRP